MPRRNIDSELDAHRDVVAHIRDESGFADAAETYANCWKLREWRDRLQVPGNENNTMSDFARYVWDSMEAGTWDQGWNSILFRMMGKNMPPKLRQRVMANIALRTAARPICNGNGQQWFTNPELIALKQRMGDNITGTFYKHPGRHFIDEIPDG